MTSRLKGLPTQRLMSLVAAIVGLLPVVSEQVIATLKSNLPCTHTQLKCMQRECLPRSIAEAMSGMTFDYETSHALFAFIDWAQASSRLASAHAFKPP
ncbi:MAG: hypothetical protein R3C53_19295 [Pirellulaceae bacterium]